MYFLLIILFIYLFILDIFYCLELLATLLSSQFRAFLHLTDVEGGMTFCQKMRETAPILQFHIECYHYKTVRRKDSNGHVHTSTTKVTTYTATKTVRIPYWCDCTPPLYVPDFRLLIHIKTRFIIEWLHNSWQTVQKIKDDLYDKNKHRDVHCSVTVAEELPGLIKETMILNGKKKKIPIFFRWPRFILSIIGLGRSVCYHIASVASVERFRVIKKASLEAPVVTPEFCQQNQIDYSSIVPSAPILVPNNFGAAYDETNEPATVPCIANPTPLTITSSSDYNLYYNDLSYYDQIYQQQQKQFNFVNETPEYTSVVDNDNDNDNDNDSETQNIAHVESNEEDYSI